MSEFRRRLLMQNKDKYNIKIYYDYVLRANKENDLQPLKGTCVVDFMPTNNTLRVKWENVGGRLIAGSLVNEYDENYNYIDYWGYTSNPRIITLTGKERTKFVRATFNISDLDNSYLYDMTNEVYLFKGINVK